MKEHEFYEPSEIAWYLDYYDPSEAKESDNPYERFWPLKEIGWNETETILIPEPVKPDSDVKIARAERAEKFQDALLQVNEIQQHSQQLSSNLAFLVSFLPLIALLGVLILLVLAYIAYRLS
jgi:hypothetical protein